jgi:hypothetical protein
LLWLFYGELNWRRTNCSAMTHSIL